MSLICGNCLYLQSEDSSSSDEEVSDVMLSPSRRRSDRLNARKRKSPEKVKRKRRPEQMECLTQQTSDDESLERTAPHLRNQRLIESSLTQQGTLPAQDSASDLDVLDASQTIPFTESNSGTDEILFRDSAHNRTGSFSIDNSDANHIVSQDLDLISGGNDSDLESVKSSTQSKGSERSRRNSSRNSPREVRNKLRRNSELSQLSDTSDSTSESPTRRQTRSQSSSLSQETGAENSKDVKTSGLHSFQNMTPPRLTRSKTIPDQSNEGKTDAVSPTKDNSIPRSPHHALSLSPSYVKLTRLNLEEHINKSPSIKSAVSKTEPPQENGPKIINRRVSRSKKLSETSDEVKENTDTELLDNKPERQTRSRKNLTDFKEPLPLSQRLSPRVKSLSETSDDSESEKDSEASSRRILRSSSCPTGAQTRVIESDKQRSRSRSKSPKVETLKEEVSPRVTRSRLSSTQETVKVYSSSPADSDDQSISPSHARDNSRARTSSTDARAGSPPLPATRSRSEPTDSSTSVSLPTKKKKKRHSSGNESCSSDEELVSPKRITGAMVKIESDPESESGNEEDSCKRVSRSTAVKDDQQKLTETADSVQNEDVQERDKIGEISEELANCEGQVGQVEEESNDSSGKNYFKIGS